MGILEKILIIEDDQVLNLGLQACLSQFGYMVSGAFNAEQARILIDAKDIQLIILDVNLPDTDGYALCKEIKGKIDIPIVFVTARDEEADVMKGYDLGADDYITKPFNLNIFQKKIAALLKRCGKKEYSSECYTCGGLTVDLQKRIVEIEGGEVILTPTEYRILEVFILNRNRVLTKEQLLERLWDQNGNWVDNHTLQVNISRLRSKIECLGDKYIKTVFGIGYMWNDEDFREN